MKPHGETKSSIKINTQALMNVSIIVTMFITVLFVFYMIQETNIFEETKLSLKVKRTFLIKKK